MLSVDDHCREQAWQWESWWEYFQKSCLEPENQICRSWVQKIQSQRDHFGVGQWGGYKNLACIHEFGQSVLHTRILCLKFRISVAWKAG